MNTLTLEDALLVEARHLILNDYNFRSAVNHLAVNWTQADQRRTNGQVEVKS